MGEVTEGVRVRSRAGTLWGIVVIILGMFCMAVPWLSGLGVVLMVGFALIATGVAQFMYAFNSNSFGEGALRFLFSVLALLCGIALVTRPGAGLAGVTLFLAAWFIVDGLYALFAGFKLRPIDGWGMMVFSGITSVLLGVMIYYRFPVSAIWLVGVLVGIRLIVAGWTMVVLGSAGRVVANEVEAG